MRHVEAPERLASLLDDIRSGVMQYGSRISNPVPVGIDQLAILAQNIASELQLGQLSDALGVLGAVLQAERPSEGALVEALIAVDEASAALEPTADRNGPGPEPDSCGTEADLQYELDDLLALPAFQIQLRNEADRRGELLLVIRTKVPVESRVGLLTQVEQFANVIRHVGLEEGTHLSVLCSFANTAAVRSVLAQLKSIPHQVVYAGSDSSVVNRTVPSSGPAVDYETAERIGLVLDGIGAAIDAQSEAGGVAVRAQLSVLRTILRQRERRTIQSVALQALRNVRFPPAGFRTFSAYGSWIRLLEPMATGVEKLIEAIATGISGTLPFKSARLLAGETEELVRLRLMFDKADRWWWKCLQAGITHATGDDVPADDIRNPSVPEGCDPDRYRAVVRAVEKLKGSMSSRVYTKKGGRGVRVVGLEVANSSDLRSVYLCRIADKTIAVPRLYAQGPYEISAKAVSEDRLGGRFVRVAGSVYPLSDVHSDRLPDSSTGVMVCRFPTKTAALLVDSVEGPRMMRRNPESNGVVYSLTGKHEYPYLA